MSRVIRRCPTARASTKALVLFPGYSGDDEVGPLTRRCENGCRSVVGHGQGPRAVHPPCTTEPNYRLSFVHSMASLMGGRRIPDALRPGVGSGCSAVFKNAFSLDTGD